MRRNTHMQYLNRDNERKFHASKARHGLTWTPSRDEDITNESVSNLPACTVSSVFGTSEEKSDDRDRNVCKAKRQHLQTLFSNNNFYLEQESSQYSENLNREVDLNLKKRLDREDSSINYGEICCKKASIPISCCKRYSSENLDGMSEEDFLNYQKIHNTTSVNGEVKYKESNNKFLLDKSDCTEYIKNELYSDSSEQIYSVKEHPFEEIKSWKLSRNFAQEKLNTSTDTLSSQLDNSWAKNSVLFGENTLEEETSYAPTKEHGYLDLSLDTVSAEHYLHRVEQLSSIDLDKDWSPDYELDSSEDTLTFPNCKIKSLKTIESNPTGLYKSTNSHKIDDIFAVPTRDDESNDTYRGKDGRIRKQKARLNVQEEDKSFLQFQSFPKGGPTSFSNQIFEEQVSFRRKNKDFYENSPSIAYYSNPDSVLHEQRTRAKDPSTISQISRNIENPQNQHFLPENLENRDKTGLIKIDSMSNVPTIRAASSDSPRFIGQQSTSSRKSATTSKLTAENDKIVNEAAYKTADEKKNSLNFFIPQKIPSFHQTERNSLSSLENAPLKKQPSETRTANCKKEIKKKCSNVALNNVHNHIYLSSTYFDRFFDVPMSKIISQIEKNIGKSQKLRISSKRIQLTKKHSRVNRFRHKIRKVPKKLKNSALLTRRNDYMKFDVENLGGLEQGDAPNAKQVRFEHMPTNVCEILEEINAQLMSNRRSVEKLCEKSPDFVEINLGISMRLKQLLTEAVASCKGYIRNCDDSEGAIRKLNDLLSVNIQELRDTVLEEKSLLEEQEKYSNQPYMASDENSLDSKKTKFSNEQETTKIAIVDTQSDKVIKLIESIISVTNDIARINENKENIKKTTPRKLPEKKVTPDKKLDDKMNQNKIIKQNFNKKINQPTNQASAQENLNMKVKTYARETISSRNRAKEKNPNENVVHAATATQQLQHPKTANKLSHPATNNNSANAKEITTVNHKLNATSNQQHVENSKSIRKGTNYSVEKNSASGPTTNANVTGDFTKQRLKKSQTVTTTHCTSKPTGAPKNSVSSSATGVNTDTFKRRIMIPVSARERPKPTMENAKPPRKNENPSEPVATAKKNLDKEKEKNQSPQAGRISNLCEYLIKMKSRNKKMDNSEKNVASETYSAICTQSKTSLPVFSTQIQSKSSETNVNKRYSTLRSRSRTPRRSSKHELDIPPCETEAVKFSEQLEKQYSINSQTDIRDQEEEEIEKDGNVGNQETEHLTELLSPNGINSSQVSLHDLKQLVCQEELSDCHESVLNEMHMDCPLSPETAKLNEPQENEKDDTDVLINQKETDKKKNLLQTFSLHDINDWKNDFTETVDLKNEITGNSDLNSQASFVSMANVSCTAQLSSVSNSVTKVSSRCCQVSFSSCSTKTSSTYQQSHEEKSPVNLTYSIEKDSLDSSSADDDSEKKKLHQTEMENRANFVPPMRRRRKKFGKKNMLSMNMLKEFLYHQGVSIDLINKVENEFKLKSQNIKKNAKLSLRPSYSISAIKNLFDKFEIASESDSDVDQQELPKCADIKKSSLRADNNELSESTSSSEQLLQDNSKKLCRRKKIKKNDVTESSQTPVQTKSAHTVCIDAEDTKENEATFANANVSCCEIKLKNAGLIKDAATETNRCPSVLITTKYVNTCTETEIIPTVSKSVFANIQEEEKENFKKVTTPKAQPVSINETKNSNNSTVINTNKSNEILKFKPQSENIQIGHSYDSKKNLELALNDYCLSTKLIVNNLHEEKNCITPIQNKSIDSNKPSSNITTNNDKTRIECTINLYDNCCLTDLPSSSSTSVESSPTETKRCSSKFDTELDEQKKLEIAFDIMQTFQKTNYYAQNWLKALQIYREHIAQTPQENANKETGAQGLQQKSNTSSENDHVIQQNIFPKSSDSISEILECDEKLTEKEVALKNCETDDSNKKPSETTVSSGSSSSIEIVSCNSHEDIYSSSMENVRLEFYSAKSNVAFNTIDVERISGISPRESCKSLVLPDTKTLVQVRLCQTEKNVGDNRSMCFVQDISKLKEQNLKCIVYNNEEKTFAPSKFIILTRENLLPLVYVAICTFVFWCLQFSMSCEY